MSVVFHYRNCPFPFHGRFFFGGGRFRHFPSHHPLRDFKTLYIETFTHLQISENILWGRKTLMSHLKFYTCIHVRGNKSFQNHKVHSSEIQLHEHADVLLLKLSIELKIKANTITLTFGTGTLTMNLVIMAFSDSEITLFISSSVETNNSPPEDQSCKFSGQDTKESLEYWKVIL